MKQPVPLSHAVCAATLTVAATAALAQATAPAPAPPPPSPLTDPAQLQRQREALERGRLATPPKPLAPRLIAPAAPQDGGTAGGPSFVLKKVEFVAPSQLLTPAELDAVIAPRLGKSVNFADVRALAQDLNALYVAKGHLTARAFVPSQKIADGVLKVQLIEARLSRWQPAPGSRLSPAFVEALLDTPAGTLIDTPALNKRLALLHRNTDTRVGLAFAPADAKEAGLSVIQLQTEEPPFWTARLAASNEGADTLGKNQLSATLALNNLLGRTDRLSLLLIGSDGSVSGSLQYSLPLPGPFMAWGTRLTAGVSVGKTQSSSPGFEAVQLDGKSDGASLALAQPLWAAGPWTLDGGLSLSQTNSTTDIAAERFSDIRTRSTGLTATLARNSEGASAVLVLAYSHARTTILGLPDQRSNVIQLNASAQQLLGAGFWLAARAGLQRSSQSTGLPPTLQFQIGGPGNVRGYPSPSATGDEGETASLELHRALTPISERLDAFVFVDAGRARSADALARTSLASAGLGLNYSADTWAAALTVAAPTKDLRGEKPDTRVLLRLSFDLDRFLR